MQERTRDIALAGVLSAVAILLAVTRLGFIPFVAGTAITIMHVPVIIGAVVAGPLVGTMVGLIFGISSMILASVAPTGPGDAFFTDPWVSVAPRLFIAVAAWGSYRLVQRAGRAGALVFGALLLALSGFLAYTVGTAGFPLAPVVGGIVGLVALGSVVALLFRAFRAHPEELALSLAAVGGTLANTGLVLGALVWRGYVPGPVALTLGVTNGPLEMVGAAVITVAVVAAWRQVSFRSDGSTV
jgi:uncharacterized membrane protein